MASLRMISARQLVGRTVVSFNPRPFAARPDAPHPGVAHNPVLILDDGAMLTFFVEETETGEYGVCILRHPPTKKARKAGKAKP